MLLTFEMSASEFFYQNNSHTDTLSGFENESIEEYLVRTLGPKRLPLAVVLPITIIYVTIFVTGIIGNVAVCVVIARNRSMRTATNYYLFSLAVSDLTLLLLGECCMSVATRHSAQCGALYGYHILVHGHLIS